jgi:hypothetical protein
MAIVLPPEILEYIFSYCDNDTFAKLHKINEFTPIIKGLIKKYTFCNARLKIKCQIQLINRIPIEYNNHLHVGSCNVCNKLSFYHSSCDKTTIPYKLEENLRPKATERYQSMRFNLDCCNTKINAANHHKCFATNCGLNIYTSMENTFNYGDFLTTTTKYRHGENMGAHFEPIPRINTHHECDKSIMFTVRSEFTPNRDRGKKKFGCSKCHRIFEK